MYYFMVKSFLKVPYHILIENYTEKYKYITIKKHEKSINVTNDIYGRVCGHVSPT